MRSLCSSGGKVQVGSSRCGYGESTRVATWSAPVLLSSTKEQPTLSLSSTNRKGHTLGRPDTRGAVEHHIQHTACTSSRSGGNSQNDRQKNTTESVAAWYIHKHHNVFGKFCERVRLLFKVPSSHAIKPTVVARVGARLIEARFGRATVFRTQDRKIDATSIIR